MIRKIITIDTEKCTGCGLCVDACHEGAIGMRDGKAVLLRDDYCDGLGDCLPACPAGAIAFEEREALPYDEAAVRANMRAKNAGQRSGGCPGSAARALAGTVPAPADGVPGGIPGSCLAQWPVQIKLAPVNAACFKDADLLVAADCSAYAYGNFHREFMDGKVTLIGCPKLDGVDYTEKLTAILRENNIRSVTLTRMIVPCCGGLEHAVKRAVKDSGKTLPCRVVTLTPEGGALESGPF